MNIKKYPPLSDALAFTFSGWKIPEKFIKVLGKTAPS
jgi:hypothetical protein